MIFPITEPTQDAIRAGWDGPGWYFSDETEAYIHGPFKDMQEANIALLNYCDWLNSGLSPEDFLRTERASDKVS